MYPYLEAWLAATRRSEDGLIGVLIVALAAVGLLWFYNQRVAEDMPTLRRVLMALLVVITIGLAVMG